MTFEQENAIYQFLETTVEPFTLERITSFVCSPKTKHLNRLSQEIEARLNIYKLAFPLGERKWISVRGCFENACFVIQPSRSEIADGILIPGHRCIPFANSEHLPQEYTFLWGKKAIPFVTVEGEPEEFYSFYSVLGEEYAPQYVAWNNPENEEAFNNAFDSPAKVSIKTLDMRALYRELHFVPGDLFEARVVDWRKSAFSLKKINRDSWSKEDLQEWQDAAEKGFETSFIKLGPGISTEEQIMHAYFYGGKRMRETPAYSLEEFLYDKTDIIETIPYGMETRFWSAGKEIPDVRALMAQRNAERSSLEEMLLAHRVPISEFVVQSYVVDMLFRRETEAQDTAMRIVPPVIAQNLESHEWDMLIGYITDVYADLVEDYSFFKDKNIGLVRQRAGELHTAIVEFAAGFRPDSLNMVYLPQHTFIMLSQIQNHVAGLMDELGVDTVVSDTELDSINGVIDGMIDAYDETRELVEDAIHNFRRSNITLVRPFRETGARLVQISIGGTDVWRRIVMPNLSSLEDLHTVIQRVFQWENNLSYRFMLRSLPVSAGNSPDNAFSIDGIPSGLTIDILSKNEIMDFIYEYGAWTVKIIILSPSEGGVACVAGECAAPNQNINGPVRFKKDIFLLNAGAIKEKRAARQELGEDFVPDFFDLVQCNEWINKKC
ncbi:MAG: plasmid pRiA4b ORF-3 family protein [Treponema sp.]|jgi:hypothetical protein|nr:plasmid pRiA4b ORF-3 family protein [Treponema sp.]